MLLVDLRPRLLLVDFLRLRPPLVDDDRLLVLARFFLFRCLYFGWYADALRFSAAC